MGNFCITASGFDLICTESERHLSYAELGTRWHQHQPGA